MSASAAFSIDPGTAVYGATPQAVDVGGATVNCKLDSVAGVTPGRIRWSVEGTNNENVDLPTLTPSGIPLGQIVSFVVPPGANQAYLIQCEVNGGPDITGQGTTRARGKAYIANRAGRQPIAFFESNEGEPVRGTTSLIDRINDGTGATPLGEVFFIDGASEAETPNGSIAEPFLAVQAACDAVDDLGVTTPAFLLVRAASPYADDVECNFDDIYFSGLGFPGVPPTRAPMTALASVHNTFAFGEGSGGTWCYDLNLGPHGGDGGPAFQADSTVGPCGLVRCSVEGDVVVVGGVELYLEDVNIDGDVDCTVLIVKGTIACTGIVSASVEAVIDVMLGDESITLECPGVLARGSSIQWTSASDSTAQFLGCNLVLLGTLPTDPLGLEIDETTRTQSFSREVHYTLTGDIDDFGDVQLDGPIGGWFGCDVLIFDPAAGAHNVTGFGAVVYRGFQPEKLVVNNSGHAQTIKNLNGGSLAANRVTGTGGADLLIPDQRAARLSYSQAFGGWFGTLC